MDQNNHNKILLGIYSAFFLALLMNFIPLFTIQTIGGTLFIVTFILTYILKYSVQKDGYAFKHYRYITKTLWIFSLFLILGIILASLLADNAIIDELMANLQSGVILTEDQMTQKLIQYSKDNLILFLIVFLPVTFYFLYRLFKGSKMVIKNIEPQNPKEWF